MTIQERKIHDVTVVDLEGRLVDEEAADSLHAALSRLIEEGGRKLAINMKLVPAMDTTGLSEILRAYTSVTRRGGVLKLMQLSSHVRQILVVTRLHKVLEAFDDEESAVKSLLATTISADLTARLEESTS